MRDLLLKNLTSFDRKKKVLACEEIIDNAGVRTIVRRHFIYMVSEIPQQPAVADEPPYLSVVKNSNRKQKIERFLCKMKGSIVASYNSKLFYIRFMHTLHVNLFALPNGIMKYTSDETI